MEKKVISVIFCLSIVSCIVASMIRWRVEARNRTVELACDYGELSRLCLQWGYDFDTFLRELKKIGINSIAIEEDTLEGLSSEGRLTFMTGEELNRFRYLAPVQSVFLRDLVPRNIERYSFVITSDFNLGEKIERALVEKLGKNKVKTTEGNWHERALTVLSLHGTDESEISRLGLGFSKEKIERIANYGLKSILILTNGAFINEASIQTLFSTVSDWRNISGVMFFGDSVLGYPDYLDSVRGQLERKRVKLGIVEFLNQDGLGELTENLYQRIVRVHSTSPEEFAPIKKLEVQEVSRLIARFRRAVRERNVRVLHIHLPFASGSDENLQIQSNLDYIRRIRMSLSGSNYRIGFSEPFNSLPAFLNLFRFPIFLIVLILPLWLISLYRPFSLSLFYLCLFGSMALILFFWQEAIFVQVVGLIGALSFPLLALSLGLSFSQSSKIRTGRRGDLAPAVWLFLKVTVITILSGLLIASLFSRLDFMLKVHQFRGVKVSFILPLVMGLLLVSGWSEQSLERGGPNRFYLSKIREFLSRKVELSDLLIFSILAVAGIVLLLRSGNYSGPFLWEIEHRLREVLEKILIVRPRIKEFLIGHPLMILGTYLYLRSKFRKGEELRLKTENWRLFITLGLIGQVSIINSFCHAHTPLVISLARTVNGIWLGIIIGVLLVSIVRRSTRERFRD